MDRFAELHAFVRVAQGGSQAEAARRLGLTPAMVGRYLAALEARLGTRLLHRTTARQSLTEAGALYLPEAIAILDGLAAADAAVAERQAAPSGTLRISAPVMFGSRFLAGALAGFGAAHPRLSIELTLEDRVVALVEEGIDLALRIGQLADNGLVARRLAPCRTVLTAAPAYLAAHGTPATPEALRGHHCLAYAYAAEGRIVRLTGRDGRVVAVEMAGRFAANNGEALHEAALAGAGIVVSPTFIAGDALRDGRLVRVLPDWTLPTLALHAVFPSARQLPPKVRATVDWLAGQFGEHPIWDRDLP